MPLQYKKDNEGKCFVRWGEKGKEYYYTCDDKRSENMAKDKALKQALAIGYFAETYDDYPQTATENAKIALRWAEKNGWGSCGTPVGKTRANMLANRESLSRETIARMAAFERHRQNSDKELGDGCGRLMWLAWGGDEGVEWAQRKLKEIDSKKQEFKITYGNTRTRNNPSKIKSANVWKYKYDDKKLELVIQFQDGSIYTYTGVSNNLFLSVVKGQASCITEGENKWGKWTIGKSPSVGASVHKNLVKAGVSYSKGGSI